MGTIDATLPNSAERGGHVPVDCFGERGMDHRPERTGRGPLAAGLFGVPSRSMPWHCNDAAATGRRRIFAA